MPSVNDASAGSKVGSLGVGQWVRGRKAIWIGLDLALEVTKVNLKRLSDVNFQVWQRGSIESTISGHKGDLKIGCAHFATVCY